MITHLRIRFPAGNSVRSLARLLIYGIPFPFYQPYETLVDGGTIFCKLLNAVHIDFRLLSRIFCIFVHYDTRRSALSLYAVSALYYALPLLSVYSI